MEMERDCIVKLVEVEAMSFVRALYGRCTHPEGLASSNDCVLLITALRSHISAISVTPCCHHLGYELPLRVPLPLPNVGGISEKPETASLPH
jgi:hypothetical protein